MTSTLGGHWRGALALLGAMALGTASSAYLSLMPFGESIPDVASPLIAYVFPLSAALIYIALQSMWRHDPARGRSQATDAAFSGVVGRLVVFVVGLHFIVLAGLTVRAGTGPLRGVLIWLGITLVGVGNLLPRLRPNHLIGLRSERLMNDRHLWLRVNRVAAYLTVMVGLVVILSALAFPPGPAFRSIAGTVVTAIVVLAICYRRASRS